MQWCKMWSSKALGLVLVLVIVGSGVVLAIGHEQKAENKAATKITGDFTHGVPLKWMQNLTVDRCGENYKCFYQNGHLIAKINDNSVPEVLTPFGKVRATHIFKVPSGARITVDNHTIKVTYRNIVLLTVRDPEIIKTTRIEGQYDTKSDVINGWIESAYNYWVREVVFFSSEWRVPQSPRSTTSTIFLFPAIEQNQNGVIGFGILQPVLEWNNRGSPAWTIASWYGYGDYYFYSTPKRVYVGDKIVGTIMWNEQERVWEVETCRVTSYWQCTAILTNTYNSLRPQNVALFIALEGYGVDGAEDLPGDTYFRQISVRDSAGQMVNINWYTWINQTARESLDGLGVEVLNSQAINLLTPN